MHLDCFWRRICLYFLGISRRADRSTTAQRAETPRLGALNPVRHRRAHIEEL